MKSKRKKNLMGQIRGDYQINTRVFHHDKVSEAMQQQLVQMKNNGRTTCNFVVNEHYRRGNAVKYVVFEANVLIRKRICRRKFAYFDFAWKGFLQKTFYSKLQK